MYTEEEIKDFAESIGNFFLVFDGIFMIEENSEKLLEETKLSLKDKVLRNESCLPVIMALGGTYDSDVDRAKIEQIEALQQLLKARKNLQKATEKEQQKKSNNADLLTMFGL